MYEVYIDVIFLVNLLPEYIILSLVSKILNYRTSVVRIVLGSIWASLMVCVVCAFPDMPYAGKLLLAHVCGRWMVLWLVFRIRRVHIFVKAVLLAYGFTCLLGGFMEWICQTPFFVGERRVDVTSFLILTGIAYAVGMTVYRVWSRLTTREGRVYRVKLSYLGHEIEVNGLYDTGNLLTEPIGGKPVSILSQEQAAALAYREVIENYRVIPYYSVGNPGGILHGFTAEKMQIWTEEGAVMIQEPMIGVCEQKVSRNGAYELILHAKLIHS